MGTFLHERLGTGFAPESEAGISPADVDVQPGDLLLIRTPGRGYAFGRRIGRNRYDHVAVAVGRGMTMNIVSPHARLIPLSRLLATRPDRLVLRPVWQNEAQREAFVSFMEGFDGRPYDMRRALTGIGLNILYAWLAIRIPLHRPQPGTHIWVCTEAILENLRAAIPAFREIEMLPLDYYRLGFSTTNDFMRIAKWRPDLLREII